jgi:hypothetical protein
MTSRRPVYWANEPWEGRYDGRLLPFVSMFIAVPTYLLVRLLARTVPDYHATRAVIDGDVASQLRVSKHPRSARLVAWFVTSSRRSSLYVDAHRDGPRCRFIPSCGEYSILAVEKHGLWRGLWMTGDRLRRCSPSYVGDYLDFP